MRRLLLGTMLILALAVPTLAEDPPAKVRGIDKPVSLEFKDHPVGKVVEAIARFAELNVILSPDVVKERVTVSFRGVPAGKALEQVAEAAGAGFVEEAHGIFRMVKKDKLQRVEEYYRFQHLPRTSGLPMPVALEALSRTLPEGAAMRYVPQQNAVILSAREDQAKALVTVLKALDRHPPRPRATTAPRPAASTTNATRRAHYEQMLRDCKTETAAKYFVERLEQLAR